MRTLVYATLFGILAGSHGVASASEKMSLILPDAKPGECYAQVALPAEYRTEIETVVVKEATEKLEIVPAKYRSVDEQVLVSEATVKYKVVPAVFTTKKEEIEISPATTQWVTGGVHSSIAASPAMLSVARQAGIPIDSANAGQCFAEYYEPPKFDEVTEQVLVSEAAERVKIVPAKYEWVEQKVMVSAVGQRIVEVPAVYETLEQQVKVEDARVEWRKGRGAVEKIDNQSGSVMCLVEVPAVYKTVKRTVMKSAPRSRQVATPAKYETVRVRKLVEEAQQVRTEIPARYRKITRKKIATEGQHLWLDTNSIQASSTTARNTGVKICLRAIPARTTTVSSSVVATPALVKEIEVPARHKTRRVQKLVAKAREIRTAVPAVTKEISKRIKVSDSRMLWRPVLCETNMSQETITDLQHALNRAGYQVNEVSGVLNEDTLGAIRRFQSENGMPTGALTLKVLQKLGINPGGYASHPDD